MSESFYATETSTVQLGDGNSVTLRKLTYSESARLLSKSRAPDGGTDWPIYTLGLLEKCLDSWDGPGFDGRNVNAANIGALPTHIGRKLVDAAVELNRDVSADEGN
jgi:hypothetical protein